LIGHPDAASIDHPLGADAPIELGVGVEDDITLLIPYDVQRLATELRRTPTFQVLG
jgi:hypothetical protein